MNLFATVMTYPAPSANYRGESEENRAVIQKITYGRFEYPIISPESMRNALRETLAAYGLTCNRTRLNDEEQLAVRFADYPDPDTYADDFFFGYLVAATGKDRKGILDAIKKSGRDVSAFRFKRDSVLRMNLARGIEPFRNNAVFTQSPLTSEDSPWRNAKTSALLHRETVLTAFQYPFALNLDDCKAKPDWTKALLRAIGELNNVAGNHARSYFEMAPASIVVRLTDQLVAGYDTYGFDSAGNFPEVVDAILTKGDFQGKEREFYLGGKIVKDMPDQAIKALTEKGVTLDRDPRRLLATVGETAFPAKGA
ncbi:type I-B CRISPR-associated protein Cas7/Cst2/DevR [Tautonia sociabilis]|uniref:Type I-B CRISPR-associated protein Cas7/Cst2/DevR n=1 Tax=Tautonia sociabilis TaxID=2080755 RepID=A0A432MCR5_9BACT|nr:type I-B CRISPR-associated protein Cas7/Cst2/DevR [Tautonia sociabilis]RUL82177.1 type I-B CRISPR-associated protein Cas7/Cst2/DevR [Tautonia sociabilis]